MTPLQPLSMECQGHYPLLQMLETYSKADVEGPQQMNQFVYCNNTEACQMAQADQLAHCCSLCRRKMLFVSKGFQQSLT